MKEQKKTEENKYSKIWINRAVLLAFMDVLLILASYLAALLLRFDLKFSMIPVMYIDGYLWTMPYYVMITLVVFYVCRLYHSIWRLASVAELRMILTAYMILVWHTLPECYLWICTCQDLIILWDTSSASA